MQRKPTSGIVATLSLLSAVWITDSTATSASEAAQNDAPKHIELKMPTEGSLSIEVIQSPDMQKTFDLTQQTRKLFTARDYDGLEALGTRLCTEKATSESGGWWINTYIFALDRMVTSEMPDSSWEDQLKALQEWEQKKPKSILAKTALVAFWTQYGWKARGGGWANSVTDEGWRLFSDRLAKAQAEMKQADNLPQICPTLYKQKLILARGNSWTREQMDAAFDKCVKLFPNYLTAYSYKFAYLMPRWGGEEGACAQFYEESADKHGKGIEGDKFYAKLMWNLDTNGFVNRSTMEENKLNWSRAKAGFEALLKEKRNSLLILSEYTKLANFFDDKAKARELFGKIGKRCEGAIWGQNGWQKYYFNEARLHAFSNKKYSDETESNQ